MLQPKTKLIGVVKASAYGSDSIAIAQRLVALGIEQLAVAYTGEGEVLRKNGIACPILVFYPQKENIHRLITTNLQPALYSKALWKAFAHGVEAAGRISYPVHLKYNTGLNRIGFAPEDFEWIVNQLTKSPFELKSVYSHLGATEDPKPSRSCDRQIKRFLNIKERHEKITPNVDFHLLNSSGIFNYPELHFDGVRSGIALHGFANRNEWDNKLRPVSVLSSHITQIHRVAKGESVGYNDGWTATKNTKVATLPIGHADGIGRHLGHGKACVNIHGKRAYIVGNVCMDMLMVDVTSIDCDEGDAVMLFGTSDFATTFAENGGSISYELLSGIGARIPRYIHE